MHDDRYNIAYGFIIGIAVISLFFPWLWFQFLCLATQLAIFGGICFDHDKRQAPDEEWRHPE